MHFARVAQSPGRTPDEQARLLTPEVSYMEIPGEAGGFSCGTCIYAGPNAYCMNQKVLAPVSPSHGCCNLFFPADRRVTFPRLG